MRLSGVTHTNNIGPVAEVGQRVLDIVELDLAGLEGAAALLEAGVLVADSELLGEVLRRADLIDAAKIEEDILLGPMLRC
jgi:hypothetical protein